MCRLFGWAAANEVSAVDLLGDDMQRLRDLSRLHQDGWGIATQGESGLRIVREDVPAYESVIFTDHLAGSVGQVGIVHLRWATGKLARCVENTHPFVRGDVAFMHNGSLPVGPELLAMIDDDLLESIEGTTDSEHYFMALLSARRKTPSLPQAIALVLDGLAGLPWPSLNMMWAEPDWLHVLCAHQPEFRAAELPDPYYHLQYGQSGESVIAWSSEVTERDGTPLSNRSVLSVQASTGQIQVTPL
jgi:predicted glutamine amidotransferase